MNTSRPLLPAIVLLSVLLLSACTSIAPPAETNSNWTKLRSSLQALDTWEMRGRVDVRYNDESNTPRIRWSQQLLEYNIRLWGTLNAGNTLITGKPGLVTLEQGNDVVTASSAEDLILQQLGYELPVSYLEFWVKGIPSPASRFELEFNELNQLQRLRQDGWTVTYPDIRQYGELTLPRRVEVTRPQNDIRLRFIGLSWILETSDTNG
jgi:outer membrane lipoprotein LolB